MAAVRSRLLAALRCCASSCRCYFAWMLIRALLLLLLLFSTLLLFLCFFWFNLFLSLQHVFIWYHLAYSSLLQALVLQQLFIMAPDAVGDMYVMISTPFFFFSFFSQYVGRTRAHAGTHRCTHPHMHRRTHIACVLVFVCTIACFSDVKLSSFPQNAAETFIMWASASASIWFI